MTTKYVSPTGCSDTPGGGSEGSPFCTVQYGVEHISASDILYVKNGTYNESFTIRGPAGSAGNPTRILAYPGHTPILNGPGTGSSRMKIAQTSYIDFEDFIIINNNQGLHIDNDCGVDFGDCSAHHINVRRITVHDVGQEGIAVRTDLTGAAVTTHVHDVLLEDCIVYNTGLLGTQNGEGIYVGSAPGVGGNDLTNNVTIRRAIIHDTQDEMIELKSGSFAIIVEYCDLYGTIVGSSFSNGAGLIEIDERVSSQAAPGHIIRGNVLHNLTATGFESAIRAGAGSDIYNNVIYSIGSLTGITSNVKFSAVGASDLRRIYHNTVDRPSANVFVVGDSTNNDLRNNIGPTGTNNLAISSAYFVNYGGNNYHLVAGAAPIGAGANLTAVVAIDKDGVVRSTTPAIGAYELVSSSVITRTAALRSREALR